MKALVSLLSLILCLKISSSQVSELDQDWQPTCPGLHPYEYKGFTPRGNLSSGIFREIKVTGIEQCILTCCKRPSCNIILMHNDTCYHVQCVSNVLCTPLIRPDKANANGPPPSMVLVRPVKDNGPWSDWLNINDDANAYLMDGAEQNEFTYRSEGTLCETTIQDCGENEICMKQDEKSICHCVLGYERNRQGDCKLINEPEPFEQTVTTNIGQAKLTKQSSTSVKPPLKQLLVKAVSKEVRLPENEVTLSAYTVATDQADENYNYVWSLLSQPDGQSGDMEDQNRMTVKLSHLSEGLYMFKVAVSSPNAYGEAYANVSVLPPQRVNQAPIAVISPASQVVKLPNTGAVLDGSASTDDDKITLYRWELQQGPIGYQRQPLDTSIVQLNNLIAGNYTFKLTVEDSDHVTNFTTANITVLKEIDYPPSANAGQDIIIHLPQNTITLNGNLSTDDRGIVSWEWTKSPINQNKVADMQYTRTQYLELSNLEEGMYTFVLKVTDESEQSSTAEVHVFVKPPTNKPPNADAGEDIIIALPETRTTLNGNKSKDDNKIAAYSWEQINGPNQVTFAAANESVTNITGLTKGEYTFKLTVVDEDGNKDSDTITVTVTQNKNAAPKANAGGDQVVVEPINIIVINGSLSTDDLRIKQWLWTRDPTSLAIGTVLEGTDQSPILMLSDVVPGRYVFSLKVTDDQGLNSEDTVSVIVKPDPHLLNLVELTLNVEVRLLTKSQKDSLIVKLQMLLHDGANIVVRNLRAEPRTGRAVLVFYVDKDGGKSVLTGPEVVQRLREKLAQDSGLLQLSVSSVETAICQNNCSGHGVCDQESRQCLCEAFWMQNLIQKYFGNGESNCDWSILYVIIALLSLVTCWVGCIWGLLCLMQRVCLGKRRSSRPKKKPARYSLLQGEPEDETSSFSTHNKMMLSESDTDSDDVLFESRKGRSNGHLRNGKSRNGFMKMGPRVKT
ncbi:dyslexia-associated protein KIAA0319-like protein [Athalia rosae]|uniref:dyslexia-associated protein KIAA0319-like protein n=1 Tax=Athalia rosae TaxID=37344 RepID=UPI002034A1D4|nr:dyslexia-associated protein KIAA0319-like protein [Athalia rosae]XP_048510880.1 dyslexia-associated protein KIAA0319-like protein [Athalia rosae]